LLACQQQVLNMTNQVSVTSGNYSSGNLVIVKLSLEVF
jgi:hypothetical protein